MAYVDEAISAANADSNYGLTADRCCYGLSELITNNYGWLGDSVQERLHIDMGTGKVLTRFRISNQWHSAGGDGTTAAMKDITVWGSNSATSYNELTYGTDTGWTQITINPTQIPKHTPYDTNPDYQNIVLTNSTSYRYYCIKSSTSWGAESGLKYLIPQSGADNQVPNTPSITYPTEGLVIRTLDPTFTASAFSDPDAGNTHAASQWQVSDDSEFSEVFWDSEIDEENLTSITPTGTFTEERYGTTFYIHVKYLDSETDWSEYSPTVSFEFGPETVPILTTKSKYW